MWSAIWSPQFIKTLIVFIILVECWIVDVIKWQGAIAWVCDIPKALRETVPHWEGRAQTEPDNSDDGRDGHGHNHDAGANSPPRDNHHQLNKQGNRALEVSAIKYFSNIIFITVLGTPAKCKFKTRWKEWHSMEFDLVSVPCWLQQVVGPSCSVLWPKPMNWNDADGPQIGTKQVTYGHIIFHMPWHLSLKPLVWSPPPTPSKPPSTPHLLKLDKFTARHWLHLFLPGGDGVQVGFDAKQIGGEACKLVINAQ